MKRLIFCFDGTWNKIDSINPTNVARIAQSVSRTDRKGNPQIVHYDEGVGTTKTAKWSGGIFGHGLKDNILEAYHFLVLNYDPGDQIYVFGFSRGAFTARSFVGLVRNCGIMSRRSLHHIKEAVDLYMSRDETASPNAEAIRQFRFEHCPNLCLPGDRRWRRTVHKSDSEDSIDLHVRFLGVWDTVGALGIPRHLKLFTFVNKKYEFHDTALSSFVRRARHAVAADEKRRTFEPGLWSNLADLNEANSGEARKYEQLIFPGTHSAVGGGGPVRGLSDAALEWIFKASREEGLAFDTDRDSPLFSLLPHHRAQLFNAKGKVNWSLKDRLMGMGLADRHFAGIDRTHIHHSLIRRFHTPADELPERRPYRPPSLKDFWPSLEKMRESVEIEVPQELIETKSLWDDRNLRAPDEVRTYVVEPGDTLRKIAEKEMAGPHDQTILFLHNQNIGILYQPDELYSGMKIEIPSYKEMSMPAPSREEGAPPSASRQE